MKYCVIRLGKKRFQPKRATPFNRHAAGPMRRSQVWVNAGCISDPLCVAPIPIIRGAGVNVRDMTTLRTVLSQVTTDPSKPGTGD